MKEELNRISESIIGAAIVVHKELGPGLLESAYRTCLEFELKERGISVQKEIPIPVVYRGIKLECGYRLDLLVENRVIVEIKAVDRLHPVNEAQLLSYLRLRELHLGLLINFHVPILVHGIKRVVRQFPE